nr:MAG TPA: hypothetical protein [Myoviridae sp. ctNPX13]
MFHLLITFLYTYINSNYVRKNPESIEKDSGFLLINSWSFFKI